MKTSYEVNTAERIQLALDGKLPKDKPITEYERACCQAIARLSAMRPPEDYEESLMQHGIVR
jgi:hypothetical protein